MNLRDHIIEWLDSLGADGLMKPDWEDGPIAITPDDIMRDKDAHLYLQLVPAFRHADGTWHTEAEELILVLACKALRAEVEELRGLIEEVVPVGDIADGLAPYYIEADTIRRMRKALEGKE